MEDLLSEFSDDGLGDTSMRADVQISKKTDEKQKDVRKARNATGGKLKFAIGDSYKLFSATQITSILDCMEANPQLWDKRNDGYKDRTTNLATWHSLEKTLGFLVVDRGYRLQKVWTALLGAYKKQKDILKGRSGSGLEDIVVEFEYFDQMKFVDAALSSSAPSPSVDSTRNITKRLVEREYDAHEKPNRKKSKKYTDNEDFFDFVRRESQTIDNSIEKLLNTLNKNDENEKKSQHKDIMDKVNHTLAALNPSDQFDCKVALAQVCDRFLRKGSAHFSQYDDSRIVQTPRTSMRSSSSMRIPSRSSNGNSSSSNRYVAEECSTSSITHREDLQLSIGDPSYTEQHYPNYHHSTDSYTPMQYTKSELGEEFEVVSYEDETF